MKTVALPTGAAAESPLAAPHEHHPARPVGGRILTPGFWVLAALAGAGAIALAIRFVGGLGAATALSDGYPWGIWIAFDVVVGTALGCGGYAVALLVYVLNRGRYHPLVRPAVLTSALGYSMAAFAIVIDVGRFWNIWKIPVVPHLWNLNSALLEVALCVMSYLVVLYLELSPAAFELWEEKGPPRLRAIARAIGPKLEKALPWLLALGLLLPTMHQSSLGSVAMLFGGKLHPVWQTPLLPLLFLVSVLAMGYAAVVLEAHLSATAFKLERETRLLGRIGRIAAFVTLGWIALRLGDLAFRGQLGAVVEPSRHAAFFWLELLLFGGSAAALLGARARVDPGRQLLAGVGLLLAGTLYRFDTYLIAFDPGSGWSYFPSVGELFATIGIVAIEVMLYVIVVKKFPILRGAAARHAKE